MKRILKTLLLIVIFFVVAFGIFLIYATLNDYKPDDTITVYENKSPDLIDFESNVSLMIWNIGYAGLNKEMDFFYDGGKQVRPSEEKVIENIQGIKSFLSENADHDFILLQEVDRDSKRSYNFNEFDTIADLFKERNSTYGKNYDVFFVPTPPKEPMGKVDGGLMTVSKYIPSKSVRHSFPGNYNWPTGLFMLDRCFLVNRYNLTNDKEFIVINTHNSAYDDGSLKAQQMEYLKTFLEDEYSKGNYIIVGGDWNQCPPNFTPDFKGNIMDTVVRTDISTDYLNNWEWLYDNSLPTNRRVSAPYKKGETLTTVIDFYLLSPNIETVSVKNIHVGFEYSDHQAVKAEIKFK